MQTTVYKSHYGWAANSMSATDANGNAWQISTSKSGRGVSCTATQGKDNNGMFSYEMFGAKRLNLTSQEGQCNEKKVREVHAAGLQEFERIMSEQAATETKPLYVVGVGQIIFTHGYQEQHERVIYEITSPGNYKTVTLDGQKLQQDDHVKNYKDKFGIGVYYNEGEILPIEEVMLLVEQAKRATIERQAAEQVQREEQERETARKIEAGAAILQAIPAGVKAVIVAELRRDESDIQSDYHAHGTDKVVFLAWSTHDRDIFSEMRKAAGKFEETANYATAPEKPQDAGEYWTAPDEHREKYSMGDGYYLGQSKYSGWIIKKRSLSLDGSGYGTTLKTLQIAAAEGRFLCGEVEQEPERVNIEPVKVEEGKVKIIEYSEKSIAVVGDTRPIKDMLKGLGGKFNFRLSCGAGWIFPKTQTAKVVEALKGLKSKQDEVLNSLHDEKVKMVESFSSVDREIYGAIQPATIQAAAVQQISLF